MIGQRLHEDDLPGHLLAEGGWEHICLPMEFETGRMKPTSLGWTDPRPEVGELLWPALFSRERVDESVRTMRPHHAAGQLQQRPSAPQGELFKREWFPVVVHRGVCPPTCSRTPRPSATGTRRAPKGAAPTRRACSWRGTKACGTCSTCGAASGARSNAKAKSKRPPSATHKFWANYSVWQEQEPGSGGKESAENTVRNLAGFAIHTERVTGEKQSRWEPWEAQLEAGNVRLVRGEWNKAYIDEHCAAPNGKYKDQIDASAGAFMKLAKKRGFFVATGD